MTLMVEVAPELEDQLRQEAAGAGIPAEEYAARTLAASLQRKRNQAAIRVLESFYDGDEEEQRETLDFLTQALDEDRLSDRKLFL